MVVRVAKLIRWSTRSLWKINNLHSLVFEIMKTLAYAVICLAVLISMGSADGGWLRSSSSVGSDGTTFTVRWSQGVSVDYDVRNRFGGPVAGVGSCPVYEGPNSCNSDYPTDGSCRAYYVTPGADSSAGPQSPDGYADCNLCDCEAVPNTNYECQSNGECEECNACDGVNSDPGEDCVHINCDTYDIVCDASECDAQGESKPSCDYSGSCDDNAPDISWTDCDCSGDSCDCRTRTDDCRRSVPSSCDDPDPPDDEEPSDPNTCSPSCETCYDCNFGSCVFTGDCSQCEFDGTC